MIGRKEGAEGRMGGRGRDVKEEWKTKIKEASKEKSRRAIYGEEFSFLDNESKETFCSTREIACLKNNSQRDKKSLFSQKEFSSYCPFI